MTRALIVAKSTDRRRQARLAEFADELGYTLAGVVTDPRDAWAATLAGQADVVLVDTDAEIPGPLMPRFESVEGQRRRAQEARRRKPGDRAGRRAEILPR